MITNKKIARRAGFWYLLMAIFYSFSMIYVDSAIYVPGDTSATIENILSSEIIVIMGLVCCLAGHVSFLFLANVLYKLFKPVKIELARIMVIFIVAGVSIAFLNRVHQMAGVLLLNSPVYSLAFDTNQLHGLVMLFLDIFKHGEILATVFWGLWLLPLGLLIFKSNFIPKILGMLLIGAGISYIIKFFLFFFIHNYAISVDIGLSVIETVAEVSFIFWLLIKGVKNQKTVLSV